MSTKDNGNEGTKTTTSLTETNRTNPVVTVDYAYYARYLTEYDLTGDQQRDLIDALANIIMAFIDLGFGVAPGQIEAETSCEKDNLLADFMRESPGNLLYSETLSDTFKTQDAVLLCAAKDDDS